LKLILWLRVLKDTNYGYLFNETILV